MKRINNECCKINGCNGGTSLRPDGTKRFKLGYCESHYRKFKIYGDPLASSNYYDNHSNDELYATWCGMKQRCYDKNSKKYGNYGGRGISVCEDWILNFNKFKEDMGCKPIGHSLDRIDVNGNYEKDNCRWADAHTQASNKTTSNEYVGVYFNTFKKRWFAYIKVNGRKIAKTCSSKEDAYENRKILESLYLTAPII